MVMQDYKQAARDFIDNEKQFHLGAIPTEQSNPLTRGLSGRIKKSTADGVKMILDADCRIPEVSAQCFESDAFKQLVADIRRCIDERRRFHFSSVGASGRMALQLDSTWRLFWTELATKLPLRAKEWVDIAECSNSFMTGGDRACVRSVENFEDYQTFGAQQTVDSGAVPGDVLIVLAECSLSSSTIGSACKGADMGIATYYLYCNPREILCEHLERARRVFSYDNITFLPLYVGNMAVCLFWHPRSTPGVPCCSARLSASHCHASPARDARLHSDLGKAWAAWPPRFAFAALHPRCSRRLSASSYIIPMALRTMAALSTPLIS